MSPEYVESLIYALRLCLNALEEHAFDVAEEEIKAAKSVLNSEAVLNVPTTTAAIPKLLDSKPPTEDELSADGLVWFGQGCIERQVAKWALRHYKSPLRFGDPEKGDTHYLPYGSLPLICYKPKLPLAWPLTP